MRLICFIVWIFHVYVIDKLFIYFFLFQIGSIQDREEFQCSKLDKGVCSTHFEMHIN